MDNSVVNNETIVNYLLGSLPEAETERLDELSITDDEFAVALNAAEKDLVDAFVQGELTGARLEKFRSHYLASPLRRGKLSFAQAFGALAKKHSTPQTVTAPDESPAEVASRQRRSRWLAAGSFFRAPRLAWRLGSAFAAIALLIAGSWLAVENMRLRRQLSQTQARPEASGTREHDLQNEIERQRQAIATTAQELARMREERERLEAELKQKAPKSQVAAGQQSAANQQRPSSARGAIASFILTPQMRGVQQPPTISIPAGTGQVSMQLQLEPNDYRVYRVALIDQNSNQNLWRSSRIKATDSDSKTLRVAFDASLLRSQAYLLRVMGISADGAPEIVGEYPFRVVE